jgi:hypothetical protein
MRSGGLSIPAAYQHRWATNTGGLTTPAGAQPDPFTLRQVAKEAAEDAYAGKVYPPMRDRMFKLLGQGGDFTARRDFNAMLVAEFADVADGSEPKIRAYLAQHGFDTPDSHPVNG